MRWRKFASARKYARSLGLKSWKEWQEFCKSGRRPHDIPAAPAVIYKDCGWVGLGDWLGTGTIANRKKAYPPYAEARAFVHGLGFKSWWDWQAYCQSGKRPDNIPSAPWTTYKDRGWINLGDWLGACVSSTPKTKGHLSYAEARAFVHTLGLKSQNEWKKYCKDGKKPSNIPHAPWVVYKDNGWISWGDWLGTGSLSPTMIRRVRRKTLVENIESIKDNIYWLPLNAWWYILIQSGIEPTSRHARLLKATQDNTLSLADLIEYVIDGKDIENGMFGKPKKPNVVRIIKLLECPMFAGADAETISAVMSELKAQLWDCINEDEEGEIDKFRLLTFL